VKRHLRHSVIFLAALLAAFASCKKKKVATNTDIPQGNYFSINQFMLDEWNTYAGEPFMIKKTTKDGDKVDSSLTNSDVINWGPLLQIFRLTDISDKKFLGQYKFSQFDDKVDETHNFFYEADEANEDLFTRKLLITIDAYTAKIKGIYIETEKKDLFDDCVQKLYYAPLKTVQIQTEDKPLMGSKTYVVETYDFLR